MTSYPFCDVDDSCIVVSIITRFPEDFQVLLVKNDQKSNFSKTVLTIGHFDDIVLIVRNDCWS